ncbi:hypothetical protein DPMN_025181 [Dreissena polymorpha]|uniref:Sushi domain-containing protein n=1 Tax=Dreissena polymorpha TaxID=45954 RepID=A0A9D4RDE0_DREPO|nr:hypothetical protein DPMN_025181 [Dreissena polymorpha]
MRNSFRLRVKGVLCITFPFQPNAEPTCADPPVIANGTYTPAAGPYTEGASVSYMCDTGWEPDGVSGLTLKCTSGTWDGTPPNCKSKVI